MSEHSVICPKCNQTMPAGHKGRRGVLIDQLALLVSKTTALKNQLEDVSLARVYREGIERHGLPDLVERLRIVAEALAKEPL